MPWTKQEAKLQQSLNCNRYLIARYELYKMYNIWSQSNQPTELQINTGNAWRQQWINVINAFHINAKQTTDVCQPIGSSVSDTHSSVPPSFHTTYCLQFDCLTISALHKFFFIKSVVYLPTHAYYYAVCPFHFLLRPFPPKKLCEFSIFFVITLLRA